MVGQRALEEGARGSAAGVAVGEGGDHTSAARQRGVRCRSAWSSQRRSPRDRQVAVRRPGGSAPEGPAGRSRRGFASSARRRRRLERGHRRRPPGGPGGSARPPARPRSAPFHQGTVDTDTVPGHDPRGGASGCKQSRRRAGVGVAPGPGPECPPPLEKRLARSDRIRGSGCREKALRRSQSRRPSRPRTAAPAGISPSAQALSRGNACCS